MQHYFMDDLYYSLYKKPYLNRKDQNSKYDKYGDREAMEAEIERDAKVIFKEKKKARVEGFTGYHNFLDNDYSAEVYFQDRMYPTATHAFHAARCPDEQMKKLIYKAPNISTMYEIAKSIPDPADWGSKKVKVMETIIRDKFRRHKDLKEKLLTTQNREITNILSEKNPNNLFWGVVNGKGQNHLGRILEQVRQDILDESDLIHWLLVSFNLQDNLKATPAITFEVTKEGEPTENINMEPKPFYFIGKNPQKCDIPVDHASVSRVHAALIHDKVVGVQLIDLGSKGGTKIDGQLIRQNYPYALSKGNKLTFGQCPNEYKINIDFGVVQRNFEQEKKALELELMKLEQLENPDLDIDTLKATLGLVKQDTIFVGGLPYSTTEKDVQDIFHDCGKITSIRIPEDFRTKMKKGFAFVTFENDKSAKKACKYDGHMHYERKLRVSIADKKQEIDEKKFKEEDEKRKERSENAAKYAKEAVKDFDRRHNRSRDDDRKRRRRSKSSSRDKRRRSKKSHRKRSYSDDSPSRSSSRSSSDSRRSREKRRRKHRSRSKDKKSRHHRKDERSSRDDRSSRKDRDRDDEKKESKTEKRDKPQDPKIEQIEKPVEVKNAIAQAPVDTKIANPVDAKIEAAVKPSETLEDVTMKAAEPKTEEQK